ncbi:MAG: hypothetical protein HYZ72_08735 [Deltaproteobacteria bacterium]|nr:hypothetical protein [Deltaproteobacteria bacterium]
MAPAVVHPLKPPGIASQQRLHQPTRWRWSSLKQEMQVVGHENGGIKRKGRALARGLEGGEEGRIVGRAQEHGLAIIPAGHEVGAQSWPLKAGVPGQARRVL